MTDQDDIEGLEASLEEDLESDALAELLHAVAATPQMGPVLTKGMRVDETFEIERQLGAGGMGVVYLARDLRLQRQVALKVHRYGADQAQSERMLREAKAMARLSHPNVVRVYEVGTLPGGQLYIVMEFLEGQTARDWQKERSGPEILALYLQAGRGLVSAHRAGLIHRDFKPENVLLSADGRACVADFGVAMASAEETEQKRDDLIPTSAGAALSSAMLGTPAYMPPEQFQGQLLDARADQFAFCVTLYEALYRTRPFSADSVEALVAQIQKADIRTGEQSPGVPAGVRRVLTQGMRAVPEERHSSMEALLAALTSHVERRKRRRLGISVAVAAIALAGLTWAAKRGSSPCEGAAEPVKEVWNEAVQARIEGVLRGVEGSPKRNAERVSGALSSYAQRLSQGRVRACEATWVQGAQSQELLDRRVRCLDERQLRLHSLVQVLIEADREVSQKALRSVAQLPDLHFCTQGEFLRAQVKPPQSPEVRAEVNALKKALARAEAERDAGRYPQAYASAAKAVAKARSIAYPPVLARALFLRGRSERTDAKFEKARATFREAFLMARSQGDTVLAIEIASEFGQMLAYDLQKHDLGLLWGQMAGADVSALSVRGVLDGQVQMALSTIREQLGDYEQAVAHARAALKRLRPLVGSEHPLVAQALSRLGTALDAKGESEAAIPHLRASVRVFEAVFGPDHPELERPVSNLGLALSVLGRHPEAIAAQERSLAINVKSFGEAHLSTGFAQLNLGVAHIYAEQAAQADTHLKEAVRIVEASLGPEHPDTALCVSNRALALGKLGRLEEALAAQERVLAIYKKKFAPEHPSLGLAHINVASALSGVKRHDEALQHAREAARIYQTSTSSSTSLSYALDIEGRSLIDLGKPKPAIAPLERALEIRKARKLSPQLVASTEINLAEALWSSRVDRRRADALLTEARAKLRELGPAGQEQLERLESFVKRRTK